MLETWQDKDKRRALLLSIFLHLFALWLLMWLWTRPNTIPLDSYLVIDVGTPALSETQTDAPTAEAPAPQAAEPLVASPEVGEPQAALAPEPETLPEPTPEAETAAELEAEPEAETPEAEPVAEEPVAEEPVADTETAPPEPVAEAETVTEAVPEPEVAETETVAESEAQTPPSVVPAPAASVPETTPRTDLPPAETTTTTLPEIDEVELEPLAQPLAIPQPSAELSVPPARTVAVTPSARVAPEQAVPEPQVSATVAQASELPRPQVQASVASAQAIPAPQIVTRVAGARSVPQPRVRSSVASARSVPAPQVQTSVVPTGTIPQPGVQTSVAPGRPLGITPQAEVSAERAVPSLQVSAVVAPTGGSSTAAEAAPAPGPPVERSPGGNAERPGQTTAEADASEANTGAVASPEGSSSPDGAPFARIPYRENRERPLAVMIDNVSGYPQAGLLEASMIVEMPVEGGLTRLMTVYDRSDPARVGPVRSARDYFHEIAQNLGGVLVHDGGSPAALEAIARADLPSINAYTSGDLFSRDEARSAPYNLYTQGVPLRLAVNRLNLARSSIVSGTLYRPEAAEVDVSRVDVRYSGSYASAFRYVRDLNLYRWVRNNEDAADAAGQAVYADAVIVASTEARPIPGDPEGRLYIPMRGGRATLYLRGKAIPGRWDPEGGVQFVTSLGDGVELAPFKTWVLFTLPNAVVTEQ